MHLVILVLLVIFSPALSHVFFLRIITNGGGGGDRVVGLAREWDRDKILARDRDRRRVGGSRRDRSEEAAEEEEEATRRPTSGKSLEELFNKTRATPAVYWKPLSAVRRSKYRR
jgi:hypothetical protein